MNETWAQLVFCGLLGWIAWELREIKKELKTFVLREDCRDDMHQHCDRLNELEDRIGASERRLEHLDGQVSVWHGDDNKS